MNILIPLAGTARRFKKLGYTFPKPLIQILDKPMIQWVIENLSALDSRFIFIVSSADNDEFKLDKVLRRLIPAAKVVVQNRPVKGATCSSLLAIEYINNDEELVIAAGDQFIEHDVVEILENFRGSGAAAGTITFESIHPQFSFVNADADGWINEVAEKNPISNLANVGIFWYEKGSDFVEAAKMQIRKGDSLDDQFYLAPVFNQLLLMDKQVKNYSIDRNHFYSFGTPEKVAEYNSKGKLFNTL